MKIREALNIVLSGFLLERNDMIKVLEALFAFIAAISFDLNFFDHINNYSVNF